MWSNFFLSPNSPRWPAKFRHFPIATSMWPIAAILFFAAIPASAESTICKIEGSGLMLPTAVSWDTTTLVAKADFGRDGKRTGKLTLVRSHGKDGSKVNLVFPPSDPLLGDQFEIIVFPVEPRSFRALGVAYVISDGQKHLSLELGNELASCSTL